MIASSSGDSHFIGVYAPHDKLDFETVKAPFWLLLQDVLDKIPQPEPVYILGDWNVRLQGRKSNEKDVLGPHVYGKGVLSAKTGPERNRDLYINLLKSTDSCDVFTYKTPNLLHQVTYRDKAPPPIDWGQFALDSIRVLQFWDKVAGLPIPEEESLTIGQTIRGFLTEEPLMQATPLKPQVDPYRFQSLDRLVTRRKWLPSVKNVRARHDTGFPSDHYLIISHVQVKLGAKPPAPPRPPRLDYTAEQEKVKEFQSTFRTAYSNSREREPRHQTANHEYQVYTDGSGSRGQATSATPAGWGVIMQQGHSHIEGYGRVNTDYSSPFYLGATVGSNNTAELSAIMEAMLYLLHAKVRPGKVVINYDSKWAAQMTRGHARPKRHKIMVANARCIYEQLDGVAQVEWKWIKGHTGNEGNEKADQLAEQGRKSTHAQGLRYEQKPPVFLSDVMSEPEPEQPTQHSKYHRFKDALLKAEQTHFSPKQHVPRNPWISQDTLQKLRQAKTMKAQENADYYSFYKQVKKQARNEKRDWIRAQFGQDHRVTQNAWHLARKLKKGFQERKRRLVVHGKQVPWSKTHTVFADHLSQEQWAPSTLTQDEIDALNQTTPLYPASAVPPGIFAMEELLAALGKMRKGRTPGPDGMRPDPVLLVGHYGESRILDIMNECWLSRKVPQEWKDAQVISFYKGKGDDSSAANYRPIALLNTLYKLYASMIQARLSNAYDDRLRRSQYGFRKGRGTEHALYVLRRLQDYSLRTGTPFHCLFIDWKQAFDKVDHFAMISAIKRLGVHGHYVDIISDIYTDPTFYTLGINGDKAQATPHTGIRQGCPLSPYLFIMVLTDILSDVDTRLITHGVPTNTWSVGKPTSDLEYADDTLLFGISTEVLEEYLCHLQSEASLYGLLLNLEKTELLNHPKRNTPPPNFIDGTPVKVSDTVKYLGSHVTWYKPTHTAIQQRILLANTASDKLSHLWRSQLSRGAKVHIFVANIVPVLLHGIPALSLEPKHFQKLDAWFYSHLRRVLGIKASYYSHVSNRAVWEQAHKPIIPSQTVLAAQFRLLLQSLNADPMEPIHHVAFAPALKDRVACHKHHKTGPPPPHWLSLVFAHAMEFYEHTIGNDPTYCKSIHGLKLYIQRYSSDFPAKLLAAPTRQFSIFSLYRQSIGSAWQP